MFLFSISEFKVSEEEITLEKGLFDIKPNVEVLAQYLRVYNSNQRQGTHKTKTRGEVSGGGIKPWKQKGTGRARVGSSRNPLWRHGGVAHGPRPQDWSLRLPKKMRRLAILSVMSSLFTANKLTVLDNIKVKEPTTKEIENILKNLKLSGKTLIVLDAPEQDTIKSARNLANVKTTLAGTLNAFELMSSNNVIFLKAALLSVERKYSEKKKVLKVTK